MVSHYVIIGILRITSEVWFTDFAEEFRMKYYISNWVLEYPFNYRKIPKYSDTRKIDVIILKF